MSTIPLIAVRLDVDGTLTDLVLFAGDAQMEALAAIVDGWIAFETYARPDGTRRLAVAMNADGVALQPANLFATSLVNAISRQRLPYCLHGPVVLLGAPNGAGEYTDVPALLRNLLPGIVNALKTRYTPAAS